MSEDLLSKINRHGLAARESDPKIEVRYFAEKDINATREAIDEFGRLERSKHLIVKNKPSET